jgi:hypothetical protein
MDGLQTNYVHEIVNKTEAYVRGRVHANGMENFRALLKRGLKGTYVAAEPFHLERYADEQVFRYNYRRHDNGTPVTDFGTLQTSDGWDRWPSPHLRRSNGQE